MLINLNGKIYISEKSIDDIIVSSYSIGQGPNVSIVQIFTNVFNMVSHSDKRHLKQKQFMSYISPFQDQHL